jgi:hypothetical protein
VKAIYGILLVTLCLLCIGTNARVVRAAYQRGYVDGIANQALWREHCDKGTRAPVDPPWLKREREKAEAKPVNVFKGGPGIVNVHGTVTVTVHGEVEPGGVDTKGVNDGGIRRPR